MIETLGRIGSDAALEPLLELLRAEPSSFVRREVVAALARIGDRSVVDTLLPLLAEPNLASSVLLALCDIGGSRAASHRFHVDYE